MLRLIFECRQCGTCYLPPIEMRYMDGAAASAVWCAPCQALMAARGVAEPAEAGAMAMVAAVMALKAFVAARARVVEAPAARRASAPARTRRARTGPGRARSRLH